MISGRLDPERPDDRDRSHDTRPRRFILLTHDKLHPDTLDVRERS